MIALPFVAIKLFLKSPRLLALGFFPGMFTLALACGSAYLVTVSVPPAWGAWAVWAVAILTFLLGWIAFGKVSLLPVEDAIIDEVQRLHLGGVVLPGHGWNPMLILRKLFVALFLGFVGLFAILLGFLPFTSIFAVVLASWLTAYSFLESVYERKNTRFVAKLGLLFQDAIPNFLLGFFFNLLLFVPFLNVFLLGYAQVLATLVALRREQASTDRR